MPKTPYLADSTAFNCRVLEGCLLRLGEHCGKAGGFGRGAVAPGGPARRARLRVGAFSLYLWGWGVSGILVYERCVLCE